jgi:DNA-binding MarR family transcriptional regulator
MAREIIMGTDSTGERRSEVPVPTLGTEFETSLNDLLVATFDTILKYETQSLATIAEVPVTIAEAHLIACIADKPEEATVSGLAANMQLAAPTITIAVKKLEQKGYVAKVPHGGDGRRWYIRLTDQGRRIDRAHTLFHRRMVRKVAEQFSDQERELLLGVIGRLNEFFQHQTGAVR